LNGSSRRYDRGQSPLPQEGIRPRSLAGQRPALPVRVSPDSAGPCPASLFRQPATSTARP
jgi:hypothetical protein